MGRARRSNEPREVQISKQLSQLLRHSGRGEGLNIRRDGYTSLDSVLGLPSMVKLKPTMEDIRKIVESSDKQRFGLTQGDDGQMLIRANQGHSIEGIDMDELCGDAVTQLGPDEVCCHGTFECYLQSIMEQGLKAGGKQGQSFRRSIHFSIRHPGQTVVSGMRPNCQIAIYVDLPRASRDGIRFHRSANHVILTDGINGVVPPEYFESVWQIQNHKQLYPAPATGFDLPPSVGELRNALLSYRAHRKCFGL